MRITANFATYSKRKHTVDKAIDSIIDQVDVVRVHYNDYVPDQRFEVEQYIGEDYTDRSKFIHIEPDEIAFTVDDDILVPPDYVETTIHHLDEYSGIVAWHGRQLLDEGLRYYHSHNTYHFKYHHGQLDTKIDVPGTGVMAFYSNDFAPNVLNYDYDCVVDLIIGLEAAKQRVPITCVRNKDGWIKDIRTKDNIYTRFDDLSLHNKLADEIYRLNNKN